MIEYKDFTNGQKKFMDIAGKGSIFLEGLAGNGKTTSAIAHLFDLVNRGTLGSAILILTPQRTLAKPFFDSLREEKFPAGSLPTIQTLGGLAQRTINLFWPLVAADAGFKKPQQPPVFLTIESAQYFMAKIVKPLMEKGFFENASLDENRLYSQILDNMNKSAGVGFSLEEIGSKLKGSWMGETGQASLFDQAQEAAVLFRQFCLDNNCLDFSLQLEVFGKSLWNSFLVREYLRSTYRHLIYDNIEEDIPVVHDLIREWLPDFESALLIYDRDGGFRTFLGADYRSGFNLKNACGNHFAFEENIDFPSPLSLFKNNLSNALSHQKPEKYTPEINEAYTFISHKYLPEMVDWIAETANNLIKENLARPGEIVILAPFMSDSLQFTIQNSLKKYEIPNYSHRPSRSLRNEPVAQALMTLAKLAYPHWNMKPDRYALRTAFTLVLENCDLIRADLLAQISLAQLKNGKLVGIFDRVLPAMQQRISYVIGNQFEFLMKWLSENTSLEIQELDVFLSRLFGEVLSQSGFGFFQDMGAALVTSQLIESVQKFRKVAINSLLDNNGTISQEFIDMTEKGILAAQYLEYWSPDTTNSILISPAYTFLMSNHPVRYQFWLDVGSLGWWERLFQPLTHPHVLSRHWTQGKLWIDSDEYEQNQQTLIRLMSGLIRRCRNHVFVCSLGVNESGREERGPLLQAFQALAKNQYIHSKDNNV
jgi:hypothetical protein